MTFPRGKGKVVRMLPDSACVADRGTLTHGCPGTLEYISDRGTLVWVTDQGTPTTPDVAGAGVFANRRHVDIVLAACACGCPLICGDNAL